MTGQRLAGRLLAFLVACVPGSSATPAADNSAPEGAPAAVNDLAQTLAGGVLETQLKQLEANHLQHTPAYAEVAALRHDLDRLIAAELPEIAALVAKVDGLGEAERRAAYAEARAKVRALSVRLAAQRQNVLRRARASDVSQQLRHLVRDQQAVLSATRAISTQPREEQQTAALRAIADQQDLQARFQQWTSSLREVSAWQGPAGEAARELAATLAERPLEPRFEQSRQELENWRFSAAAKDQQALLDSLQSLATRLERAQSTEGESPAAMTNRLGQLIAGQTQLRGQIASSKSASSSAELVARQGQIERELAAIKSHFPRPEDNAAIERAASLAAKAGERMFQEQPREATELQDSILASLSQLAANLARPLDADSQARSADDARATVAALRSAEAALLRAQSPANPPQNGTALADTLRGVAATSALPADVRQSVLDAERAVAEAGSSPAEANPVVNRATSGNLSPASLALAAAIAQTQSSLARDERQAQALAIGELARASEALERAAASAQQPEARNQSLEVANQIAQAVTHSAPSVALSLGGVTREAQAGLDSGTLAARLSQAAADLRAGVGQLADELSALAGRQLGELDAAREQTDRLLAGGSSAAGAAENGQATTATDSPSLLALAASAGRQDAQASADLRAAAQASAQSSAQGADAGDANELQNSLRSASESMTRQAGEVARARATAATIARLARQQQDAKDRMTAAQERLARADREKPERSNAGDSRPQPPERSSRAGREERQSQQASRGEEKKSSTPQEQPSGGGGQMESSSGAGGIATRAAGGSTPVGMQIGKSGSSQAGDAGGKQPAAKGKAAGKSGPPGRSAGASGRRAGAGPGRQPTAGSGSAKSGSTPGSGGEGESDRGSKPSEGEGSQDGEPSGASGSPGGMSPGDPQSGSGMAGAPSAADSSGAGASAATAARSLLAAAGDFAHAQRGIGHGAAALAGQRTIGNAPLRAALQLASQLSSPTDDATLAAGGAASGQSQAAGSLPGAAGQGGGMGNHFVPNSPGATAATIAGGQSWRSARTLAADQSSRPKALNTSTTNQSRSTAGPVLDGSGGSHTTSAPNPSSAVSVIEQGGSSSTGTASENRHLPPGELRVAAEPPPAIDMQTTLRDGDIDPLSAPVEEEPWFARLPAAQREALRVKAQSPPPARYQQRLRRYFEFAN